MPYHIIITFEIRLIFFAIYFYIHDKFSSKFIAIVLQHNRKIKGNHYWVKTILTYFIILYVWALASNKAVSRVHAWCLWEPEEGIKSPKLKLQIVANHWVGAGN